VDRFPGNRDEHGGTSFVNWAWRVPACGPLVPGRGQHPQR
jgi:hypothetical protein